MEMEKLKEFKKHLDEQKKKVEDLQKQIITVQKELENDEPRFKGIEDTCKQYEEENKAIDAEIKSLEAKLEGMSTPESKIMDMEGFLQSFAEIALKELIFQKSEKAESMKLTKKIHDCNREAQKCSQKLHALQITLIKLHKNEPQASKTFVVEMEGMREIFTRMAFLKELIMQKSDKEDAVTLAKVIQDCSEEFRKCCRKIQSIRRQLLRRYQSERQNSGEVAS